MIHYLQCPVCKSTSIKYSFSAKDNTVSKEAFEIWECSFCTVLFTQDVPSENNIGDYYASPDYVSHSDTQEGFVNKMYHGVKILTLAGKKKLLVNETGLAAGKILDVGSGTGAFLDKMKKGGWQVTGVEPDAGARAKAASLYNIHLRPSVDLFELPEAEYDAITLWHVLEHVHSLHEYVDQLKKLITTKGRIFIAVPNHTSHDANKYKEHWAAFDVPRHLYHFSPLSINVLMEMHGLKVKKIKPMWFDSFYVSMLSEHYKNGKQNLPAALISGMGSNAQALFNNENCSSVIYIISNA